MDPPATFQELTDAFKESLQRKGVLDKIRATLRAEMYHALEQNSSVLMMAATSSSPSSSNNAAHHGLKSSLPPPLEHFMINEMVHEYLCFHGYTHTASVLESESEMGSENNLGRDFIQREIGFTSVRSPDASNISDVPLLYELVETMRKSNKRS